MSPLLGTAGYLLGFPTPVVEVVLTLIVLFVALATYLGTQMEGIEPVETSERRADVESEVSE